MLYELSGESGAVSVKLPLPGVASCRYGACWTWMHGLPLLGWHHDASQTVSVKQHASVPLSLSSVLCPPVLVSQFRALKLVAVSTPQPTIRLR